MSIFQFYQLNCQGNSDILSIFICESINNFIKSSIFPFCLKHADMIPQHKNCIKSLKETYIPVSILPIYQNYLSEVCLSKCQVFLYVLRKGFSTEQCLSVSLGKWERSVDRSKVLGALLKDLSKVFDFLNHDFLIAKLDAYVTLCAIWHHLCSLKNVKNTHGEVFPLVKLQALWL